MFGCAGSLLLHRLLSSCSKQAQGLLSSCSVWASCDGGFSCEAQALGHVGFFFLNKVFNSDNSCLYSFTVTRALAYVILHACVLLRHPMCIFTHTLRFYFSQNFTILFVIVDLN